MNSMLREVRFDLHCAIKSNKSREIDIEDLQKLINEITEITKCDEVERISDSIACLNFADCDDEAVKFLIHYKPSNRIYLHVCISDPDNPEAIANEFMNDQEDLKRLSDEMKEG